MVPVTIDSYMQPQKSILLLKQTQNEKKDFLSVFNQSFSKNNNSNENFKTVSSATKQKQLMNSPEMRSQNKNRAKHSDSDQRLQDKKADMLPEDFNEDQQDLSAQFEMFFSLLETLNPAAQESIILENLTLTEGKNFFSSDEQLSVLNTFFYKFLEQHQTELPKEQFSKISEFLQFLSMEPDMESCCSQAQKLLEELKMLAGSKKSDAQQGSIWLNVDLSDTGWADKNRIVQPYGENIGKSADKNLIFSETDANLTISNHQTDFEETMLNTDDHSNMELVGILKKQQDDLEGNMILKEEQGNIQPEAVHSNHFKDIFVLENKTVVSAKPDIHHILNQVTEQAEILLNKKGAEMHLQLQPDHLGKLVMKIAVEKGTVIANIVVENQTVKEVLESNLNLLKDALNEKGFGIQGFHVSVGQDSYADKHPNLMKFKKKNIRQALSMIQNIEQNISEISTSPISLYATQIDYLG